MITERCMASKGKVVSTIASADDGVVVMVKVTIHVVIVVVAVGNTVMAVVVSMVVVTDVTNVVVVMT